MGSSSTLAATTNIRQVMAAVVGAESAAVCADESANVEMADHTGPDGANGDNIEEALAKNCGGASSAA